MSRQASKLGEFAGAAKSLSSNPLGIVALFIVLIYACASLVVAFGSTFTPGERYPLIWFLCIFPFAVLGVFFWLVSKYPTTLYAPRDFVHEENYVRTVALLAAATTRPQAFPSSGAQVDIGSIIATVDNFSKIDNVQNRKVRKLLLWVDDHPEKNIFERQAFETHGFEIFLSLSTGEAIAILARQNFSAVISDMTRQDDRNEGFKLLDELRNKKGDNVPFYIYTGVASSEIRAETARRGGQGATDNPNELFRWITSTR